MSSKPVKLSPQETRVFDQLKLARSMNYKAVVVELYRAAKDMKATPRVAHRRMQQHVGVIVARLNKKQKKYVIKPGGKDAPRTYVLRRR